ncbi:MAG: radical SAM protein [Acidobacteria bacterium]|nr:radical SAM protein [Acidobacteriota bacterium]
MKTSEVIQAWGRILAGYMPALSIEITRECPLACPGCYAYGNNHLGGGVLLNQLSDFKGEELVAGILKLVDQYRPLHLSIVGGEPLVRFRELSQVLPQLSARGIHSQVVTSAVRPIPAEWARIDRLTFVVSVDGLPAEHDVRRKPATYDRILKHIAGHRITVHCTITRQMTGRAGYLREFMDFWAARSEVSKIWMSIFTPQVGEDSYEILLPEIRARVVAELLELREIYPKLDMPRGLIRAYAEPPGDPDHCVFAKTTLSMTADLKHRVTPCQFGGNPDCSQCGCIASAGLVAVGRHRLPLGIRVGSIFDASLKIGRLVGALRESGPPVIPRPKEALTDAGDI